MAVVNKYMQEEQQRINNQKANQGYSNYNISPISAATRQQMTQVTQPAVQYTAGKNPGTYASRYQHALDSIMAQIQNPEEFKYEFNGDEMFKNLADLYTQYGKQASLDAMGQAAGLTGGYGNTYGQQVGQQTFQQYLLPLYDKGMEMQNQAYTKYQNELGNLKDAYNMMQAAETADYGRYSDAVSAWQNQQQLDLQREQWEWKKAQAEAAAAAAASGGRGGNGGGTGTQYYDLGDGKLRKVGKDGKWVEVDPSKLGKNDVVMPTEQVAKTIFNNVSTAANTLKNAVNSVASAGSALTTTKAEDKLKNFFGIKK